MPNTTMHQNLLNSIVTIMKQAGEEIIMPAFSRAVQSSIKSDGSTVTETDLASQHFISNALASLDTSIGFIGEEMQEHEQMACLEKSNAAYWCLDPLDGTSNYAAHFPGFAISLALIEQGEVVLACIHDPVRSETYTAIKGNGACLNNNPIAVAIPGAIDSAIGFIDFKRLAKQTAIRLATAPTYRSQRNIGSCALEWAWMAAGRAHFIVHGREKLWDFAAGSLIAREAGAIVGDFRAESLFPCNNLSSPILAACNATIHTSLKLQLKA